MLFPIRLFCNISAKQRLVYLLVYYLSYHIRNCCKRSSNIPSSPAVSKQVHSVLASRMRSPGYCLHWLNLLSPTDRSFKNQVFNLLKTEIKSKQDKLQDKVQSLQTKQSLPSNFVALVHILAPLPRQMEERHIT